LKPLAVVTLLLLGLAACASSPSPLTLPLEVTGTVSSPRPTNWQLDFCGTDPGCVQIGGEIYEVKFRNVRTLSGSRVASELRIAFPAHALTAQYRANVRLHLYEASAELKNGTGLEYIGRDWERR